MVDYAGQDDIEPENIDIKLINLPNFLNFHHVFKADNQRATQAWSIKEIIQFICCCIHDRNVALIFYYWKDQNGNIYIIDGSHRLSALIAWIQGYFAIEQVMGNLKFNEIEKEDLRKIRKELSGPADFGEISKNEIYSAIKQNLSKLEMKFIQVIGSPDKARKMFEQLNMTGKRLSKVENNHLKDSGSDRFYVVQACCYIDDNRVNLEELGSDDLSSLIRLGESINQHVFNHMLKKQEFKHDDRIKLIESLTDILCKYHEPLRDFSSKQSIRVECILQTLFSILSRMMTPTPTAGKLSVGLHPYIYFYNYQAKFQITSFIAWFEIFMSYHLDKDKNFYQFSAIRPKVEYLIEKYHFAITETVAKYGSGMKSHNHLKLVYQAFIFLAKSINPISENMDEYTENTLFMALSKTFPYITFSDFFIKSFSREYNKEISGKLNVMISDNRKINSRSDNSFTNQAKLFLKHDQALKYSPKCLLCEGLIHLDSTQVDHLIPKAKGGKADIKNAVILHPICNHFKSDYSLEEAKFRLSKLVSS